MFFKKRFTYFLIGVTAVACTQPTLPPIETTNESHVVAKVNQRSVFRIPKANEDILVVKGDTLKAIAIKSDSGEHIFDFYGITPADTYFNFPSHSIVMLPVNNIGVDKGIANSYCEYWLYTKSGQLVCYCKNTVSGLHPIYGNSFNANNHLPEFKRKIGYGEYRLVYKNISKVPVRQELLFGLIIKEGKDQLNTEVFSGETKEFWLTIYPSDSEFKLNNNNKWPM